MSPKSLLLTAMTLFSLCLALGGGTVFSQGQPLSREEHLKLANEAAAKFHAAIDAWQGARLRVEEARALQVQMDTSQTEFVRHTLSSGGIPNAAIYSPNRFIFAGAITDAQGGAQSFYMGGDDKGLAGWTWPRTPRRAGDDGGFAFIFVASKPITAGHAVVIRGDKKTTFYIPYTSDAHIGIVVLDYDGKTWTLTPDIGSIERHPNGQDAWNMEAKPAPVRP